VNNFQTKVVENIRTHILCSKSPPYPTLENRAVYDKVEKYGTAGQASDDNKAHALYMLGNKARTQLYI
jgi:hypothetical protein